MAKLTRNLKLIIEDNSTDSAKKNLEKIDASMGAQTTDQAGNVQLRSKADVAILPQNTDVGGSAGVGGNVTFGEASKETDSVTFFSKLVTLGRKLALFGKTENSTKKLNLQFEDANSTASRTLTLDPKDGDRTVALGGNLITHSDVELTGPANVVLPPTGILVSRNSTEELGNKTINAEFNTITNLTEANLSPSTQIPANLLQLAGAIENGDIAPGAAIHYSKLDLDSSITDSDISPSAAIHRSKLALTGTLTAADLVPGTQIPASNLDLTGQVDNSDIASNAAISRSKLAAGLPNQVVTNAGDGTLTSLPTLPAGLGGTGVNSSAVYPSNGTVQTENNASTLTNKTISGASNTLSNIPKSALLLANSIADADIATNASIQASKLNLVNAISNAQVASGAAIQGTKTDASFGAQPVKTGVGVDLQIGGYRTRIKPAQVGQAANLDIELPADAGTPDQVLSTDGFGKTEWKSITGTGTVTQVDATAPTDLLQVTGTPINTNGTITLSKVPVAANSVYVGPTSGAAQNPTFRTLQPLDLPNHVHDISDVVNLQTELNSRATLTDLANGLAAKEDTINSASSSLFFDGSKTFRQVTAADLSGLAAVATSGDKADVGLANVDNTSDANKPVSTAQAAADSAVQAFSVQRANHSGTQDASTITGLAAVATSGDKADVGLDQVDNVSDLNKPISTATQAVLDTKEATTNKGIANGYASLDGSGKVPSTQLPDSVLGALQYQGVIAASGPLPTLTKGQYFIINTAGTFTGTVHPLNVGDWIVGNGEPTGTLAPGIDHVDNTDSVSSVNGQTGAVNLTKSDIGLSDVDNTSDLNKPVSTAQAAADAAVQAFSIQRSNHTGTQPASTITGLAAVATSGNKADIGLGQVDNTSDIDKPVSDLQSQAIASAQDYAVERANHLGTQPASTITGLAAVATSGSKADVGLGNADNTSDLDKPVSTATQTALDQKAPLAHTHTIADVTGLQGQLDGKAAASHTHSISDTTGLQTALDSKANQSLTNLSFSGSDTQVLTLVGGVPAWANTQATTASFKTNQVFDLSQDQAIDLNHGLGSLDVLVQVFDSATGETHQVDSLRIDSNNVRIITKQIYAVTTNVNFRILVLKV